MLNIDIGGTIAGKTFDQLVVTGSAALNGTVNVLRINGYAPASATTIPFLTYGSESGSFATIADPNPSDSLAYGASSATITLNLATTTPQVTAINPPNGAVYGQNLRTVQISFSEGLNPATLIAANFTLQDGNGNTYAVTNIQLSNGNSQVQLSYNPLPAGSYTLTLNAPAIKDPAGNALGASNYVTQFTVTQATAVFINSAGGNWSTPSNWQNGQLPGPGDNVLIDTGNPSAVITFSSGSATVNSLTSFEPLTLSGGTLTINGNVQVNNTFTLAGGTLANATVLAGTAGQGLTCTSSGGTLSGVTLDGNLDVTASNAAVGITNGLTLNGTATIGGNGGNGFNFLEFAGSQTLSGSGTVVFGSAGYTGLVVTQSNTTLTIGAGITVHGGTSGSDGGRLGYEEWSSIGGSNTTIVNQGTIDADTAGTSLTIYPAGSGETFTNQGTIEAGNGGVLQVGGNVSSLGTLNATGGTVALIGTLSNSGNTLALTAATGSLTLSGGTIQGGTVTATGGAQLVATSSGGTLNGVTLDTNLNLTAPNAYVVVTNGLTLNGTATIGGNGGNGFNFLEFAGSQTLSGSGTVVFGSAGYTGLVVTQSNTTLTIGAGITVHGGTSGSDGGRLGYEEWSSIGGSNTTIVNQGTIDADTAGTSLTIYPAGSGETFTNQGTIEAGNGGVLQVGGNVSSLGTLNATGGTVALIGTLSNSGNTLALTAATGSLTLSGGTIQGGTVTATGGAQLVATSSGGTLNGVTLDTNLNLTAPNAYVVVTNGLTLNGTATIGGNGGNGFNFLEFAGSQTLSGSGTVVFGSAGYTGLVVTQSNTTLTIGAGITVHGGTSGSDGGRLGYEEWSSIGGSNTTIVNQGTIDADTAGTSLTIYPAGSGETFTNQGTIEAGNGGVLQVGGNVSSLGTLNATGGTVALIGTLSNSGNTLALTAATGSLTLSGGTIQGGTVTATGGAQLVATSSGGTLNGVTLDTNLNLTAPNAYVVVTNGLTLNGTATIGGNGGNGFNFLEFAGSQTLSGSGTVVFGSAGYTGLVVTQSNTTLTIGAGITVHGGTSGSDGGRLGYEEWSSIGGSNTTIVNQGTIDADTAGTSLTIYPAGSGETFTNQGTIEAGNGGVLQVGGNVSSLGTLNATGGTVALIGTLSNSGNTLALTAATGSLTLSGGTIQGGTLSEAGGSELVLTSSSGTLSGVTVNGPLDLTASGAYAYVTNGLTLDGTATLGYQARLYFNGSQTLGGTGTVVFNNASYQGLIANSNNMTLTIGAGITIHGGNSNNSTSSGSVIGYSSWVGGGSNTSIVNLGTISADTSGMFIIVNPNANLTNQGTLSTSNGGTLDVYGTWSNAGGITVNGGTLNLGGTFTTAGIGTVQRTGGTVNLTGTLTNTASTLTLNAGSGSWDLAGGTINGGTVAASGGSELVLTSSSGTLSGVTVNGPLDLTASGAYAYVTNGLTLDGTATLGYQARLYFNGSQTLGGTGTVVFNNASYQGLIANSNNMTLTIGAGITIHGGNSNNSTSSGSVIGYSSWVGGGSNTSIVNLGTISADTSGMFIIVNPNANLTNQGTLSTSNGGTLDVYGTWSNAGGITVNGGTLNLGGTFTTAGIGTVQRTGGTVNLTGTLTNTASTLTLNAGSGSWDLAGGTINGGTVAASGGSELVLTSSSGTLSGVTVNGPLDLTASGAYAYVTNGLTLDGTATLGYQARLYFNGSQTLGGTGTVVFNNASYQGLIANSNNMTLTIGAGITIHGGNSNNSTSSGSVIGYSSWVGGGSNTSIVNLGTISADTSGMFIIVNPNANLTNQGTLSTSNGGTLDVYGTWSNAGGITVNGGTVLLHGGWINTGSVTVTNSTLSLPGAWTNAGTITATANSTLNLGDQSSSSTNIWSNSGTINATNSTVNLGGLFTATGLGTFLTAGGAIDLTGTLGDTGATLFYNGSTSTWSVKGGKISGSTLFHGSQQVAWIGLGLDPTKITADITAYLGQQAFPLGVNQPVEGSLSWDTTTVPDGTYDIHAIFHDASGNVVATTDQQALVNNTANWYSGTITSNETWTNSKVNIVYGTLTVASGVTLTIQPGAIVKFAAGMGLQIVLQSGATLNAPATQTSPIIFTSLNDNSVGGDTNGEGSTSIPQAGDWGGFVVGSGADLNLSPYVQLRYLLQTVSGTLTSSETLLGSDVYVVSSTVVVPSGVTLSILPGAIIKFASHQGITVQAGGVQPRFAAPNASDASAVDRHGLGGALSTGAGDACRLSFVLGQFLVARRRCGWETYTWTNEIHRRLFLRRKWPGGFMAS